jgi:PhzF family phenazine biosynthesis protein
MASSLQFARVHCFSNEQPDSGNPAAVFVNFSATPTEKQIIARKINLPVTVFVEWQQKELPRLQYFYPDSEMPLCLHGSMAAYQVLRQQIALAPRHYLTCLNPQLLEITAQNNRVQIKVSAKIFSKIVFDVQQIANWLNLHDTALFDAVLPFGVFSVGSPKLLVPLKSSALLFQLQPNFLAIKNWSQQHAVNGLYVYAAAEKPGSFHARGFNPKTGHNEDAATGVAAAALSLALKKSLLVNQGVNLKKPCQIMVEYITAQEIWVGGRVTIEM